MFALRFFSWQSALFPGMCAKMVDNKVYTKICFVCRKKFDVPNVDDGAYKKCKRFFCSYKCLRRFEKRFEEKKNILALGGFADELFEVGYPNDEVRFKVIGNVQTHDEIGYQYPVEITEFGKLYEISRGSDGKITITVEVS